MIGNRRSQGSWMVPFKIALVIYYGPSIVHGLCLMTIGIVTVLDKCTFKTAFHPHQQATTYRLVSCGSGLAKESAQSSCSGSFKVMHVEQLNHLNFSGERRETFLFLQEGRFSRSR